MKASVLLSLIILPLALFLTSSVLNSGGSAGGYTGSPRDMGNNCTACHSGNAQLANDWITSNIPVDGYISGQTYTITATGTHTGVVKFGFETTSEDDAHNKKGTFVITNSTQTKLTNANKAVTHTAFGTTPTGNTRTWTFDWTAPESGTGNITFYGAFNATNGNGSTSGDVVYLSTYTVTELGTGIGDHAANYPTIKMYPNPFVSYLDVELGDIDKEVREIRLLSSAGSIVYSKEKNNQMNETFRIPGETLSRGIYYVSILMQNGQQPVYKVVKK